MQDPGNYETQLERVGARIRAGEWARRRRAIGRWRQQREEREQREQREYEEWEQQMETEWLEGQGGRG